MYLHCYVSSNYWRQWPYYWHAYVESIYITMSKVFNVSDNTTDTLTYQIFWLDTSHINHRKEQ